MIPRRLLWWVPAFLALHNAEEALAMARALPRVQPYLRAHAPEAVRSLLAGIPVPVFVWPLALATLVPLTLWASRHHTARWAHWSVALVQAVVALNVASHLVSAAVSEIPPGLVRSFLVRPTSDPTRWRIETVWASREALAAMRRAGTPAGVLMFRAAGAEPTLGIYDVAVPATPPSYE